MTLEELRLYVTPSTYCMIIDVSNADDPKELFKGRGEKLIRYRDTVKPENWEIWSISADKIRGCMTIRVYKKGMFKSNLKI
nr:MAG TPA: MONELLIN, CHAIN A, MONELLIN, CHAIN-beta, PLANT PROTEIN.9A [Caudoviricetes sp.]